MPSFRRQFTTSGHNPFRGKGKGPFMRDVILLKGPDINSILRQEKRVYCEKNKDKTLGLSENGMFNLLMHISINGPEANHVITMAVKKWQTTKERQKVTRSV